MRRRYGEEKAGWGTEEERRRGRGKFFPHLLLSISLPLPHISHLQAHRPLLPGTVQTPWASDRGSAADRPPAATGGGAENEEREGEEREGGREDKVRRREDKVRAGVGQAQVYRTTARASVMMGESSEKGCAHVWLRSGFAVEGASSMGKRGCDHVLLRCGLLTWREVSESGEPASTAMGAMWGG